MTQEDNALALLASFDWRRSGNNLVANGTFNLVAAEVLKQDLSEEAKQALGLHFIAGKAYVNAGQAEKIFKLEGLKLNVCKEAMAR